MKYITKYITIFLILLFCITPVMATISPQGQCVKYFNRVDTNRDGIINTSDFSCLRDTWNQIGKNLCGDYNKDGVVGLTDFFIFRDFFMKRNPCKSIK